MNENRRVCFLHLFWLKLFLFKFDRKEKLLHNGDKINVLSLVPDLDKENLFFFTYNTLRISFLLVLFALDKEIFFFFI